MHINHNKKTADKFNQLNTEKNAALCVLQVRSLLSNYQTQFASYYVRGLPFVNSCKDLGMLVDME